MHGKYRLVRRPFNMWTLEVAPPHEIMLTEREQDVLRRMACGWTNFQIGHDLGLVEDTVKTHVRRVLNQMGADNRAHAVAIGYACGLLRAQHAMPPGSVLSTTRGDARE